MKNNNSRLVWGAVIVVGVIVVVLFMSPSTEPVTPTVVNTATTPKVTEPAPKPVVKKAVQTPTQVITPAPKPTGNVVELTDKGFVPLTLEIKRGESVEFINSSSKAMVIHGSTDKPESIYPGFSQESGPLGRGGKFYFAFTTAGAWPYVNLVGSVANAKDVGVIIVK